MGLMRWPAVRLANPLARGLVAHWPMWEGMGSRAGDVVNGFAPKHGTLTNGPTWVTGDALQFAYGTDSRVVVPPMGDINAFTYICRVVVGSQAWRQDDYFGFQKTGDTGYQVSLWLESAAVGSRHWEFQLIQNWSGDTVTADAAVPAGSGLEYHLAIQRQPTGECYLFVDGVRQADTFTQLGAIPADDFWLGDSPRYDHSTNAKISESAFYDRALSPSEIQFLYEHPDVLLEPRRPVYPAAVAGPGNRRRRMILFGAGA